MTNRFFLAEHNGKQELRSSASRGYTHASFGLHAVSFHTGAHNAPAGAPVVQVKELTKQEASAYKKAALDGRSFEEKRMHVVRLIWQAGNEHAHCGYSIHQIQLGRGFYGNNEAGALRALIEYQERQAAAYQRMVLHRRALAKLDAGGA